MTMLGVDPHKRSNTVLALDDSETVLDRARFATDRDGFTAMLSWSTQFRDARWAVEGSRGVGKDLAHRLVAADQDVVDVPPQLAARVRVFSTGNGRKNDPADAHAVALAAHRSQHLRAIRHDQDLEVLKLLCDRRDELVRARTQTMNRLHRVLSELVPGGTPARMSLATARELRTRARATDPVSTARRHLVTEYINDIGALDTKIAKATRELRDQVTTTGTSLTDIPGIGPVVAARLLVEVGDITRFPTKAHFASWNGTAPHEIASGETAVHRLNTRGNRRVNHALHIAAVVQTAHDTPGRDYYRTKLAANKGKLGALRCLKRRISDTVYNTMRADATRTDPGGQTGATMTSARLPHTPTAALRTSHSRIHQPH